MIRAEARGAWREIEAKLRSYVGRRVPAGIEVDDVVQEIMLKVHHGLAGLHDGERFGGWVYRIAEHAIVDSVRARARVGGIGVAAPELAPGSPGDETELQADLGECVSLFVARLPSPYREAITLTELQGLTQKQAATMVGVSLSGMKSRVQRGRERIRNMFDECCHMSVDSRGRVIECRSRALDDVPADCRDVAASWSARHGS